MNAGVVLPDSPLATLLRAAALLRGGGLGPAQQVAGLERDDALPSLLRLEEAGIIAIGAGALSRMDAGLAKHLWHGVDRRARAALHLAIAEALPPDSEEALRHRALAANGRPEAALARRLTREAVRRLSTVGAGPCAELLAVAAEVSPSQLRAGRLLDAGRLATAAGQLDEAARHLKAVDAAPGTGHHEGEVQVALAHVAVVDGELGRADAALSAAARTMSAADPVRAAAIEAERAVTLVLRGRGQLAQEVARSAWDAVEGAAGPDARAARMGWAAVAALTGGVAADPAHEVMAAVKRVSGAGAVSQQVADPRSWVAELLSGLALVFGGRPAAGAEVLGRLTRIGRRLDAPVLTVLPLLVLAEASMRRGRLDLAARQLREAERAERRMRDRPWMVHLLGLPARLAAARGEVAAARGHLVDAQATAGRMAGTGVLLAGGEGVAAVAAGDHEEAMAAFARMDALAGATGPWAAELTRHHLDHVHAALELGATAEAAEVVARLEGTSSFADAPWPGLVLPALGAMVDGDAQAAAAEGARIHAELPLAASRIQLWAAERLHGEDRRRAAAAALEGFRSLTAIRWLRHASDVLEQGAQARPALTPRQQAIVEGVRQGRTNAQVAASLGITEQTVANHLTSIYRLLGVRGRAELIRRA